MAYPKSAGYKDSGDSKAMAKHIDNIGYTKTIRQKVLEIIQCREGRGATTEEISRMLGIYNSTVPARARELVLGGAIKKNGTYRKCDGNNRKTTVYVATGQPFKLTHKLSKKDKKLKIAIKTLKAINKSTFHIYTSRVAMEALEEIRSIDGNN